MTCKTIERYTLHRAVRRRALTIALRVVSVAASVLLSIALSVAQGPPPTDIPRVGPARGSLVIVGGRMDDKEIVERIISLAGGRDAPLVMIPTAGGALQYDEYWRGQRPFREAGATDITVLHTYNPTVADTEEFVAPLRRARGVFFGGGRQWRLADAYLNTRTHRELLALLARGGVISGSSAGASIMGSFLVRGDTGTNTLMIGDHVQGFGFLKGVGIDQHLLRRNRHFDLIEVVEAHPDLLGIGLDENTAIVVDGDRFEVIGQSYAVIYDNRRQIPPNGRFYFLAPGDRYDMGTREAWRPVETERPLDRVAKDPWTR
ncbi:MAG: cyanophycinase [Bryobacterales bacterium]|nr:cyanophycinase [Bryobacterales bacterium]